MIRFIFYVASLIISFQCQSQPSKNEDNKAFQDQIIKDHLYDCANRINYTIMMKEYQDCLDAGLKKDSTIAYLWQQKAMPYFKAKKYEVGINFLDKAVHYNKRRYLPYKGFINCIFVKNYKQAILDFEEAIALVGNNYEMDHPYDFYVALSHLQLNEFEKAEEMFTNIINRQFNEKGFTHHLILFYHGITKYELQKWQEAIDVFDLALKEYVNFSDVKFYKVLCLARVGNEQQATLLINEAKKDAKNGYTINEDNAIYETYPYKVRW
jgi:tetratricopeptide (TPR) repeat protein